MKYFCLSLGIFYSLCMFHLWWKVGIRSSATVEAVNHQPNIVLLPFLQPAVITLLLEKIPEFFFDVWVQAVSPLSCNVLPSFWTITSCLIVVSNLPSWMPALLRVKNIIIHPCVKSSAGTTSLKWWVRIGEDIHRRWNTSPPWFTVLEVFQYSRGAMRYPAI